nr:RNA-directed RNA polymerase L [Dehong virus]
MSHPTQYPDARLSSPITLDHCDLFSRSLGLYSNYSHNPKIKNCRIPHHIYRLRNSNSLKSFLEDCSLLTIPFHSTWSYLIESLLDDAKNHNRDFQYLIPDDALNYADWDNDFTKNMIEEIVGVNGIFTGDTSKTEKTIIDIEQNNPYFWGMLLLIHLSQIARRIKGQRGSIRSDWKFVGKAISIMGISDFILIKVPVHAILRSKNSLQEAHPAIQTWYNKQDLRPYYLNDEYLISIASYESFIMIKDVFIERFNTIEISRRAWLEDPETADYPPVNLIRELYIAGDLILSQFFEDGFKLIKHLEPLCSSCIQTQGIYTPRKYWFQAQMIKSYYDELTQLERTYDVSDFDKQCADNFIKLIIQSKLTPQQYCELFSVQKHWGHPLLYNDVALEKVKKHAQAVKILKPSIIFETFCVFKFIIAKNHYNSQGSWYKTTHDLNLTPYLRSHILANSFPSQSEIYPHLWEWYYVTHDPIFSVKIISDLSIFIKDRATAVTADCWDSVFDKNVLGYNPPVRFQSKRVPEQFLTQEDFSLNQVITFAERLEYLSPDYRNFSFSFKEKELNTGRTFGKLPYKVRNVQTLAEALLADGLAKAFPSNMMVVTEREQKEALLHQASWHHNSASVGENAIVRGASFVTDLEKYNLAFRFEFTRHFIEYCNNCYGVRNLFNWMHYLIPLCYMHVSDYYSPPYCLNENNRLNPPDCANAYHYHLGGIEGFQQKLWTCISCAQITLVELKTKLKLKSSVMGDNQCITTLSLFSIDAPHDYQEKEAELNAARVAVELAITTGFSGIFLKPEETFVHSGFIYFGKKQYLNGVQLPQSLKTMARCGPLSDSIFDDLQGSLASIGTAFERGVSETRHILPNRWVAAFHTMISVNLLNSNHLGFPLGTSLDTLCFRKPLTYTEKVLALITPQVLGGLSFLNPEKIFYRNISDPLTSGLFQLKKALTYLNKEEFFYILIAKKAGQSSPSDFIMNPLGLNVPGSREIITYLRQIVRQNITLTASNKIINSLFHVGSDLEDNEVCNWLLSSDPVMSRFASDIFSRTPSGKRLQVLGYLEGTRTLLASRTLSLSSDGSMLGKLRDLTKNRWKSWFSYIDTFDEELSDALEKYNCTVDIADFLRAFSWSDILKGRKLIGATLPCLLEQFISSWIDIDCRVASQFNCFLRVSEVGSLYKNHKEGLGILDVIPFNNTYVNCAIDKKVVQAHPSQRRLTWSIGNRAPYIGSRTEDKIGYPPLKVNCPSAALKETIEMVSRLIWVTQGNANTENLLKPLITSRINLDFNVLSNFLPTHYSGNIVHRYNDQYGQHSFMANRMSNTSTRAIISTNTLGMYAGGGQAAIDSNIIFQNTINLAVAIFDICFALKEIPQNFSAQMHLNLNKCCTRQVPSEYLTFDTKLKVDLNKYSDNELIYDKDPLSSGIRGRSGHVEPKALNLQLNSSDIGSYDFITIAAWTLGTTIVESILSDEASQSTDPISTGSTKAFVTQFLVFPIESILYAFGANLIIGLISYQQLKGVKDLSDLMYSIQINIQNLSHRSLRILQSTFRQELVLQKLSKTIPLITVVLGGSSGEKGVSDAVRLLLISSVRYFIDNIVKILLKRTVTLPVWLYFPSEGQKIVPIIKIIKELIRLVCPSILCDIKVTKDNYTIPESLWIYPSRSTKTNHYYASLNYWRYQMRNSNLTNKQVIIQQDNNSLESGSIFLTEANKILSKSEQLEKCKLMSTSSVGNVLTVNTANKVYKSVNSEMNPVHRYEIENELSKDTNESEQPINLDLSEQLPVKLSDRKGQIKRKTNVKLEDNFNPFYEIQCYNAEQSNALDQKTEQSFVLIRKLNDEIGPMSMVYGGKNALPNQRTTITSHEEDIHPYLYITCDNFAEISLKLALKNYNLDDQVDKLIQYYKRTLLNAIDSNNFCRFTGVVSSMHYKLYDLLPNTPIKVATCLAEGEGGGARLLLKWKRTQSLFFNTLATDVQQEVEILSGRVIPRMLYNIEGLNTMIENKALILNNLTVQETDITKMSWLNSVKQLLPNDSDLLTMDAETIEENNRIPLYEMIVKIWDLPDKQLPNISIIKIFVLDLEGSSYIINQALQRYSYVQLRKPYSSNARNSEWYLFCSQKRQGKIKLQYDPSVFKYILSKAMVRQIQAIPYWLNHIEQHYKIEKHRFFLSLGFPSLELSFSHRYALSLESSQTLYGKISIAITKGTKYLSKLLEDYNNKAPLLDIRNHFIHSLRGRLTKLYNDLLKLKLVLTSVNDGKNWSYHQERLSNVHSVCYEHLLELNCNCYNRILLKLDFIKNTTTAEKKLFNRIVGYIIMFPNGINYNPKLLE